MSEKAPTDRRQFMKLCATTAAAVAAYPDSLVGAIKQGEFFNRVKLLDQERKPLMANSLVVDESYLFFYPFVSTPCFLIRLQTPIEQKVRLKTVLGKEYEWQGGAGHDHQIVAFSAICAHKMSHPSTQVSFINYRSDEVQYAGKDRKFHRRAGLIHCCSEGSIYDPSKGAEVLSGPAPNPLATILLEHDRQTDELYAVGVAGESMFDSYFRFFSDRLRLEFKTDDVRAQAHDAVPVVPADKYCRQQILC
jgi:Rieske Fe-S protein